MGDNRGNIGVGTCLVVSLPPVWEIWNLARCAGPFWGSLLGTTAFFWYAAAAFWVLRWFHLQSVQGHYVIVDPESEELKTRFVKYRKDWARDGMHVSEYVVMISASKIKMKVEQTTDNMITIDGREKVHSPIVFERMWCSHFGPETNSLDPRESNIVKNKLIESLKRKPSYDGFNLRCCGAWFTGNQKEIRRVV